MDRGCSAGHTSQTRAGVGAPGGPRGEMRMGTVRGAGRRLPVAGGPKPAAPHVTSACRRRRAVHRPRVVTGRRTVWGDRLDGACRPWPWRPSRLSPSCRLFLSPLASLAPFVLVVLLGGVRVLCRSLASFFSSFLTAFSSCVRAKGADLAAGGAVVRRTIHHHIGGSRRPRRSSSSPLLDS